MRKIISILIISLWGNGCLPIMPLWIAEEMADRKRAEKCIVVQEKDTAMQKYQEEEDRK